MAHPVPTKAFLQPVTTATMCMSLRLYTPFAFYWPAISPELQVPEKEDKISTREDVAQPKSQLIVGVSNLQAYKTKAET